MRLAQQDVNKMMAAVCRYLKTDEFELRLYSSRVDDAAKGGDIDLLLLVVDDAMVEQAKWDKHLLLVEIKHAIGDQKIYLKICSIEIIHPPLFKLGIS